MTEEQYYAQVRNLGLRPSQVPNVYICSRDGMPYSVPSAKDRTPEQLDEHIEYLKRNLGVG